jgi:carboxylesterase
MSILDPEAREASRGIGVVSGTLLAELHEVVEIARDAIPHVTTPTLYMAARNDSRVPLDDSLRNWQRLETDQREFRLLEQSGHIMTVDYEKQRVFDETAHWLATHAGDPA